MSPIEIYTASQLEAAVSSQVFTKDHAQAARYLRARLINIFLLMPQRYEGTCESDIDELNVIMNAGQSGDIQHTLIVTAERIGRAERSWEIGDDLRNAIQPPVLLFPEPENFETF